MVSRMKIRVYLPGKEKLCFLRLMFLCISGAISIANLFLSVSFGADMLSAYIQQGEAQQKEDETPTHEKSVTQLNLSSNIPLPIALAQKSSFNVEANTTVDSIIMLNYQGKKDIEITDIVERYVEGHYQRYYAIEEVFHSNKSFGMLHNNTHLVCRMKVNRSWSHFPHFTEQFFRCISWWNHEKVLNKNNSLNSLTDINSNTSTNDTYQKSIPVLILPMILDSVWIKHLLAVLAEQWNLEVVVENGKENSIQNMAHNNSKDKASYQYYKSISVDSWAPKSFDFGVNFQMADPSDAELLRNAINSSIPSAYADGDCRPMSWARNNTVGKPESVLPIIGFLNRELKGGRHVVNYQSILDALKAKLMPLNSTRIRQIRYLESFDGMDFKEQAKWMSNIHILISPHGAQVTNAAFMPQCGGILELFPKGYYIPYYFGTLARSTGHYHYSIYTGRQDSNTAMDAEIKYHMRTFGRRAQARRAKINVTSVTDVVEATQELIYRWEQCCRSSPDPFRTL